MFVDQISVFLENKPGQLSEFVRTLAKNNIDLLALSIAETNDYGILRIIVDKTEEADALLKNSDWAYKITKVLGVMVNDEPGSLIKILSVFENSGISIAYSYAFFSREKGRACIILRVDDNEGAAKLMQEAGIEL